MTEELWNARRDLLQTRRLLYQTQQQVLGLLTERNDAELKALGEQWTAPEPSAE